MKSPTANKLTLKHETPRDRQRRHVAAVRRPRAQAFDVATWERMHRTAESATIFSRRDGVR